MVAKPCVWAMQQSLPPIVVQPWPHVGLAHWARYGLPAAAGLAGLPTHAHFSSSAGTRLSTDFTPDVDTCVAWIDAKDGRLPLNEQTWQVYDGNWRDAALTVALLRTAEEVAEHPLCAAHARSAPLRNTLNSRAPDLPRRLQPARARC